ASVVTFALDPEECNRFRAWSLKPPEAPSLEFHPNTGTHLQSADFHRRGTAAWRRQLNGPLREAYEASDAERTGEEQCDVSPGIEPDVRRVLSGHGGAGVLRHIVGKCLVRFHVADHVLIDTEIRGPAEQRHLELVGHWHQIL